MCTVTLEENTFHSLCCCATLQNNGITEYNWFLSICNSNTCPVCSFQMLPPLRMMMVYFLSFRLNHPTVTFTSLSTDLFNVVTHNSWWISEHGCGIWNPRFVWLRLIVNDRGSQELVVLFSPLTSVHVASLVPATQRRIKCPKKTLHIRWSVKN